MLEHFLIRILIRKVFSIHGSLISVDKVSAWNNQTSRLRKNEDVCDKMFCEKWNSFLQTELGQPFFLDSRKHLSNSDIYFSNYTVNDNFEDRSEFSREDWMF